MFSRSCVAALLFACLAAIPSQSAAQSTKVGKSCDLSVFGEKNTDAFLAFDRDFRDAIERQDTGKLALLTQFPLMVNDAGGATEIPSADSLQGHFAQIFTPAIRHIILSSTHDSLWCNYTGISYNAAGNVWINVTNQGFFLMTVNMPDALSNSSTKGRSDDLACHTKDRRILIDSTPKGVPRFRSWSFAQSLSGPPDLVIGTGKMDWEGTGPCAHRMWTFQENHLQITVESADGCYGDDDQPPRNAQAQITVTDATGKQQSSDWCF
jgi:hypothetical protein